MARKPVVSYDLYSRPTAADDPVLKAAVMQKAAIINAVAMANGNSYECCNGEPVLSNGIDAVIVHPRSVSFVPLDCFVGGDGAAAHWQIRGHPDASQPAIQNSGNVPLPFRRAARGSLTQCLNGLQTATNFPNGSTTPQPSPGSTVTPMVTELTSSSAASASIKLSKTSPLQDLIPMNESRKINNSGVDALPDANRRNSCLSDKTPFVRQNDLSGLDRAKRSSNISHYLYKPEIVSSDARVVHNKFSILSVHSNWVLASAVARLVNPSVVLGGNSIQNPTDAFGVSVDDAIKARMPQRPRDSSVELLSLNSRLQIGQKQSGNGRRASDSNSTDVSKENLNSSRSRITPLRASKGFISESANALTEKESREMFIETRNKSRKPFADAVSSQSPGRGSRNRMIINEQKNQKTSQLSKKQSLVNDLPKASVSRPLPPRPQSKVSKKILHERVRSGRRSSFNRKLLSLIDDRSCSSYQTVLTANEFIIEDDDDSELDSLVGESCLTDCGSNVSDEDLSSLGTKSVMSLKRCSSSKVPVKAYSGHSRELPQRKMPGGSKQPTENQTSLLPHFAFPVDHGPLPALTESLFSNIPPKLNFVLKGQTVESLPSGLEKLLRWRISTATPTIVKECIARSGFKPTAKSYLWLGYWGKHIKYSGFKAIREYQKMNHFPGTFQLGRKDRLWRNLSKMLSRFGRKEFGFFPQTFILPADRASLRIFFEDGSSRRKWIIKPPASACGTGIHVIHKWNEIPKNRSIIVQHYIANPYLINDSKFDLRIYVYVTSFDPLRIYVYEDGLVRFASVKYSNSMKKLRNRYMHLTNYSVNKFNSNYEPNSDEDVCQGHKWSLKALWTYLQHQGVDSSAIWSKIKDLVIKTVLSAESLINSSVKENVQGRYCCHELFGFDVLLDEKLEPWIIEVNISPSLHSNSQLDINIKGAMIRDLFNLVGFMIPDSRDVVPNPCPAPDLSSYQPMSNVCIDRRLCTNHRSPDEKAKHIYYMQRHTNEQALDTILDVLTPDDIRILTETVDENSRCGDFLRVFPTSTSQIYHAYFDQPRYYNLLLQAWCTKHQKTESRGISSLETFCRKGINLQNPTLDPKHQWIPPPMHYSTKEFKNVSPSASKTTIG